MEKTIQPLNSPDGPGREVQFQPRPMVQSPIRRAVPTAVMPRSEVAGQTNNPTPSPAPAVTGMFSASTATPAASSVPTAAQVTSSAPASANPATPTPVAPAAPTAQQQFMAGSSVVQPKVAIPLGIYVIVGLQFLGAILSFMSTENTKLYFTIVQVLQLLIGVGLLLRLELARKAAVIIAGLLVVLAVVNFLGLMALQNRVDQNLNKYNQAIQQVEQTPQTAQQQAEVAQLNANITQQKKQEGHAMTIAEVNTVLQVIVAAGMIIYLNLPKVRSVFRSLES